MEFPIAMAGEILDFSPWINTYGQQNSIPMNFVLQGEETYYEVDNVDDMIYCLFAYPLGHQWAFPDQECELWLDGGSHVTIVLQTELPSNNQVFFSEYIEGSSYNKAVEIFNATAHCVDLSDYTVVRANNGSYNYHYVYTLTGMLDPGDVYVITDSRANNDIKNEADLLNNSVVSFNGDDYLGLIYDINGADNLVDVIGIRGQDPGSGWAVAGMANAALNHTLVRKSNVNNGNVEWLLSAGTDVDNSEWIVYPNDTFAYIGEHDYNPYALRSGDNREIVPVEHRDYDDTPELTTDLLGNYPNPFNPDTKIEFSLSQTAHAVITIYNIKGEKVRTLTDNDYPAGIHQVNWNGRDDSGCCVSSGIYFYKLEAGATNKIKKMMLLQ
jgi:hypothetical protein